MRRAPLPPERVPHSTWRSDVAWLAGGGVAILVLLWACRGFPLGVPVADDYAFLERLAFHRLDGFNSMGATYYWRPLSRQLYFSALGGGLLEHPWRSALVHVAALLVTYVALWGIARRGFTAPVATAIAVFPLISEPARVLLAWPSGAQHLLAGMFAAIAIHEAVAARVITALAAVALGMLCHESCVLALPVIPALAWWRARDSAPGAPNTLSRTRRDAWVATLGALAVFLTWTWGYSTARAHGVALPPLAGPFPLDRVPELIGRVIPAALNLEDLAPIPFTTLAIGHVLVIACALMLIIGRRTRVRVTRTGATFAAGLTWLGLGILPLAPLLPDWNAWRAWLPTLGFGACLGAALAFVHPMLAVGFVSLRLAGLLLAPPGPPIVEGTAPATRSHMSYVRLVRLQRTVESTRRAMLAGHPELGTGAVARYSYLPQLTEVGFQENKALRVWYRDSTLSWNRLGGITHLGEDVDALLEYRKLAADPAQSIERPAFEPYFRGAIAMVAGRMEEANAEFDRAAEATRTRGPFYALVAFNRAWIAIGNGDVARADSLLRVAHEFGESDDPDHWALVARIAIERNDRPGAVAAVQRCLELDPNHGPGLEIVRVMKEIEALEAARRDSPQQSR